MNTQDTWWHFWDFKTIQNSTQAQEIVTSLIVFGLLLLVRYFLMRAIRGKSEILDIMQRRWMNRVSNSMTVLLCLCFIFIWAPQLQSFALSITAFSVAIMIGLKELVMCLTGGFLRASSQSFEVGDWVEVDDITGEVLKVNALSFLLEEIQAADKTYQFTGRTISVPNSSFLAKNVINLNFIKHYIYYDVDMSFCPKEYPIEDAMYHLKQIAEKHFSPHRALSIRYNRIVERKTAVDFCDPEPQIFLSMQKDGFVSLNVRLFLPTQQAAHLGTKIIQDFLSVIYHRHAPVKE